MDWGKRRRSVLEQRPRWRLIRNCVAATEALEIVDEGRSIVAERIIEVNGVELCTEPFGDPVDPPILLIMGR
jgi:hypothetical protein